MLENIAKQFFPYSIISDVKPFGNGHINNTYKVITKGEEAEFILQRINTDVFKNPQEIAKTHLHLQDIIFKSKQDLVVAKLIPTSTGENLFIDNDGGFWRATSFIQDSYTIEVVKEPWQAFEAGNAFGWFAKACRKLNPADFEESIKDFHRLSFRIAQLDEAIENDKANRLNKVISVVDFFKDRQHELSMIETWVDEGEIPLRMVHNDTKINNLLFRGEKAAAVIDLDTVGPGILYYDYGDALRTSANTASEDEKNLDKVEFHMGFFEAFTKGYLQQVKSIMNTKEEKYLYLAPKLMTYIIAIRFLTDYLNGDVYYKTAYDEHNLVRCEVQKKLIESMETKQDKMKQIIEDCIKTYAF